MALIILSRDDDVVYIVFCFLKLANIIKNIYFSSGVFLYFALIIKSLDILFKKRIW